jgi:type I restriction enzyme S subunit
MPQDMAEGQILSNNIARVPDKHVTNLARHQLKAGDIVFSRRGDVGRFAVVGEREKGWLCGTGSIRIRLNCPDIDTAYLRRFLQQDAIGAWLLHNAKGVTMPNLNTEIIRAIPFAYPPLDEQRRIAAILDQADDLRRKRRQALQNLQKVTRVVFLEMFGDPIANKRGWRIIPLGDAGTLDRGVSKHRPRNDPVLLGGPYPLIQTGDIANCDGYVRAYDATYSEEGLKQSKLWPAGTLCITIAANIGKTGILSFDACFPDSIVGFVPSSEVRTEFAQQWFVFVQPALEKDAPQFAQKNINLAILRALKLPIPSLDMQRAFAACVAEIDKLKAHHRAHLAQLDALFASLQHRAFRGEL